MILPSPAVFGRLVASLEEARRHDDVATLLSPITSRLPAQLADLASSLPIGDANGELLEALRSHGDFPTRTVAGVLATDPFRLADDLLEMLRQRGCNRVANWPSTAMLGGELGQALAHSGLGYAEEMAFLARARQQGFETLAVITQEQQLVSALAAQPSRLLIAVALEAAEGPSERESARLASLAERIRDAGYPLWLYEHDEVKAVTASLHHWAEVLIRHSDRADEGSMTAPL
ncbi:hypothetical protein HOP51_00325 [Halomonas sp. MCCC 1A11036]|uniref:TIM-barrel domain-containing protein n=2 Tax=Billgrantia zhangzhouensis TaxID=2733481 RepID=A0ABS9A9M5_9GAMM|nr:hypothetical protein [Halomonas zhangzhouensis]